MRRIFDAGSGTNVIDVPFRFYNALVAGLAFMVAVKRTDVDPMRVQALKMMYDEAWDLAAGEDREKAADRFVPREMFF